MSTPQANAFASPARFEADAELRRKKTVALARLLNEYVAELCRVWPERFSWLAVTALPFVEESVREVRYALEELGAVGVSVLTNAEGVYPGDVEVDGLWEFLEGRARESGGKEIVFVHPTDPVIKLEDGRLISSRPCEFSLSLSVTQELLLVFLLSGPLDSVIPTISLTDYIQHPSAQA